MDAVFHRLWSVEIYGFLLLATSDVLISRHPSSGGPGSTAELRKNDQRNALVSEKHHFNSSGFTGSRFTCNMNISCFSMWIVEPKCWNGFLEMSRNGYIRISLGVFHCQADDLGHYAFAVYWFWGSALDYLKEITRCRHFSVCRIRALTVEYSPSSKHWLNILVNSNTGSFLGSVSVAADLRFLKKDLPSINATRTDTVSMITHSHSVVYRSRHSILLQTEATENMPRQRVEMNASRKKRDVNEAEDLAVLMEGENPESKAKIVELISTDFASGGFSDPVVSQKGDTWNNKLGPKLGKMVRNLYVDLNAQSQAAQGETAKDELDMISPHMIQLRQKIKHAEREIAHSDHELKVANKKHADVVAKGGDTSQSLWNKSRVEKRLDFWIQAWKNMKQEYESTYTGSSSRTGRKLQAYFYTPPEWADWSQWSKCSVDCGQGGFSVRRRECLTTPYVVCPGAGSDMRSCGSGVRCEARFHDWGEWGPCSVTCGKGVRARSRVCVTADKEMKCKGPSTTIEKCSFPKCKPKARPVAPAAINVAPVVAGPSVAYILSPGIAFGANAYPVAQPAPGSHAGEYVAVPETWNHPPNYPPSSMVAGGAAGFGAGAAASVEHPKGPISKVTVVETGNGGGPLVMTHHEAAGSEEEETVTTETILFIVLFLLCLLLLIIAFCIYCYQRTRESDTRKRLKEARPFYKQDVGDDDDDLYKYPAQGRVKPVCRLPPGYYTEPPYCGQLVKPTPAVSPEPIESPTEIPEPEPEPVEEQLVEVPETPSDVTPPDVTPPDQMLLAGQQVGLDKKRKSGQGGKKRKKSGQKNKPGKGRKSAQGKKLGGKRTSSIGGKRKSSVGGKPGERRKSSQGLGKKRGSSQEKKKSAQGGELGEKRGSSQERKQSAQGKTLGSLQEGKIGEKKKSVTESSDEQSNEPSEEQSENELVAGQSAVPQAEGKTEKKKKKKKKKKKAISPGSSTPQSDESPSIFSETPEENKSASNIASDKTESGAVDVKLNADRRKGRTLLKDYSAGDSLRQDGGLLHSSKLQAVASTKEQSLPTLNSTSHFKFPLVEGKHVWRTVPSDQAGYLENLSSRCKVILNKPMQSPSCEYMIPVGEAHVAFSSQETYRGRGHQWFNMDRENRVKSYHDMTRWNRKIRKFRGRKRAYKRAARKMNTYLKSVFKHKCDQKHKHCQFDLGLEKHIAGIDFRSLKKNSRVKPSSESDTYPKDDSSFSANSSFYINTCPVGKTVNRLEEKQRFMDKAQANKPDLRQESKLVAETKILSCKTRRSLSNTKQALPNDLRSRSSLHYKFPVSVYSAQRQRRGKFTSSSSSWLSTLLSESDRKLNEIERDMDAVLKEQCRLRDRNTISLSSKAISGETLQASMKGEKGGGNFTRQQKSHELSAEDISYEGIAVSRPETKCLKLSESVTSTVPKIDEEARKCDDDDGSIHTYERKKEDVLKLLHSTPLYQNRGQSLYRSDPWNPRKPQNTGVGHAYRGHPLLNSNLRSEGEHIKGTDAASLTSQTTSAGWTDQDSKGDIKTTSDTSNFLPSSSNQQTLTDSSENNMHSAFASFPFTSNSFLNDVWQTDRSKILTSTDVSGSVTNDNCNPNDDTWRNIQRATSEKSEAAVRITDKEHSEVHKKTDVHGRFHVSMQFQKCSDAAHGFSACGDGRRRQQIENGWNMQESSGCHIVLSNPQAKDQTIPVATTCRSILNENDGSRKQTNDKINISCKNPSVKLASAPGRSSFQDPAPGRNHMDIPCSSYTPDSVLVPVSVMSSYQEHVCLQNKEKPVRDDSGPAALRQGQAGYEQMLDKQLEQFVDSTSWISSKDCSKIHIEWKAHKDNKRKQYNEMLHKSMLSQDTHHLGAASTCSTVTSMRGLDSGQYVPKSYDQTKSTGSMFHKQGIRHETYQEKCQEQQQNHKYNAVSIMQKQACGLHEEKSAEVIAQNSYHSFPEVSRTSDKTVSVSVEEVTTVDDSKWHSACSGVPVGARHYSLSSIAPLTPDKRRGHTDTCDSLASIYDNFSTPESEMSWKTSKTNGSACKSTYESPCEVDGAFCAKNRTYNSSIPCSLNRTFSLESSSSCNNSAACDTSAIIPHLSEYQSVQAANLTSSRNISPEDVCIFKDVLSSYDSCSDSPVTSSKESQSVPDSTTTRASSSERSRFDLKRPELCDQKVSSSYIDSQSVCLVSETKQKMPKQAHVKDSCSDSICKENSNYDTFSVSVQFSDGNEIIQTGYSKKQEERQVCQSAQHYLSRLKMGQECSRVFYQEVDSDTFDDSPALALSRPAQQLALSKSSEELLSQIPFQALAWSAESPSVDDFSSKHEAVRDVQQFGDMSTSVHTSDDFDEWETKIDYMSFVNEADIASCRHSTAVSLNTTYNILSPKIQSSKTTETSSSSPYSNDSSVSGHKRHTPKFAETVTSIGDASKEHSQLDKQHRSEEMSISSNIKSHFFPRTDVDTDQGFRHPNDRNADSLQDAAAVRCCMSCYEDSNSENGVSSTKPSEMKYTERFVPEEKKIQRHASRQTQQKWIDKWNSSAVEDNIMQTCGAESSCPGPPSDGVEQNDSFTARLELATVFYKRTIQWSPLLDGRADNDACDTSTSVCPSWTLDSPAVIRQAHSAVSLQCGESRDVQHKNSYHRTETSRSLTPESHTHQTAVCSSASCGYYHGFRNMTTSKVEKSSPCAMFIVNREVDCGESVTTAVDTSTNIACCSEKVHSKSTLQATSLLSSVVFRSSPLPRDRLLVESAPRAGQIISGKAVAWQSLESSCVELFSSDVNSGVTDSSLWGCGSNTSQEKSVSVAQEGRSEASTNHASYIGRTKGDTATRDSLDDSLHDFGKRNEWKNKQRNTIYMLPELHLAATVDDVHETDVPENMMPNGESSLLSSVCAAKTFSPSDSYECETCSSPLFSGKMPPSGVNSFENLLCGSGRNSSTDPHTLSCSREKGGNKYCQRQAIWKPKEKRDVVNIIECDDCHSMSRKTVLCSSPESVHSSIFDVSCHLDDSSDEKNNDYNDKHTSGSGCASYESDVHSKEYDPFLPSSYCSDDRHSYSQASQSFTPADSSDKNKACSHRKHTLGLRNSDETGWSELEKHESNSWSSSSKSNPCFSDNFSSNSQGSSDERHKSSTSSLQDNSCVGKSNMLDQAFVNKSSPISEIPHELSWAKSFRIYDDSVCSPSQFPLDVSITDDCQSDTCMSESSAFLDEFSVGDNMNSHASSKHCPQGLCRRQSVTYPRFENHCLQEYSDVMNLSYNTDEPGLMPSSSHYPQIAASWVPELSRRHTSHYPERDHLCSGECSEVINHSFNTDEPELLLYNCRSQSEVNCIPSSQLLVDNNELRGSVVARDTVCRHQARSLQGKPAGGNILSDFSYDTTCSVAADAGEKALIHDSASIMTSSVTERTSMGNDGQVMAGASDIWLCHSTSDACHVRQYVDDEDVQNPHRKHLKREEQWMGLGEKKMRNECESKLTCRYDHITAVPVSGESGYIVNLCDHDLCSSSAPCGGDHVNVDSGHIRGLSEGVCSSSESPVAMWSPLECEHPAVKHYSSQFASSSLNLSSCSSVASEQSYCCERRSSHSWSSSSKQDVCVSAGMSASAASFCSNLTRQLAESSIHAPADSLPVADMGDVGEKNVPSPCYGESRSDIEV